MFGRSDRVLVGVVIAGWLGLSGAATAEAAAPAPVDSVYALADRLLRQGAPDSSRALVEPLVNLAVAEGDTASELRGRLHLAAALAMSGQVRKAEISARRAGDLARAQDDPARGRMAARWLGYALLGQGRGVEAEATYQQLLTDAIASGDRREEAYSRTGLAYLALGRGETAAARDNYERAAPLFHGIGETGMELDALVGLARTLGRDGRFEEMKRIYNRVVREGEQAGLARVVGFALNNLGTYEYQSGDPGLAVDYWQRVLAQRLAAGDPSATIMPAMNLALARLELGAYDEAISSLRELRDLCQANGYGDQAAGVLAQLASIEQLRGNPAGAQATWRQIMGQPNARLEARIDAALQITLSLVTSGHPGDAIAFCDSLDGPLGDAASAGQRAELDLHRATALAALERPEAARPLAAASVTGLQAAGLRRPAMLALVQLAKIERTLALPDSALVHLRQAQSLWEDLRAVPRDPQWREQRGSLGGAIHLALADLLLAEPGGKPAPERVRAAFDALQGYKARTLLERMLGPDDFALRAGSVDPPVTLERLQGGVLLPGELLLDFYLGENSSLLFAVNDKDCRVVRLPGSRELGDRVRLFLDLLALPEAPIDNGTPPAFLAAGNRIGGELLAPVAAELAASTLVTIAADGILNRLPFEMLPWSHGGDRTAALGQLCDVARAPSATLLARLRGVAGGTVGSGVLVLADPTDTSPSALPGVRQEVQALVKGYRGVAVLSPGCDSASSDWFKADAGKAVIHVPAHCEAFDQRPWNSRVAVGHDAEGEPCWLLSSDIAALPLDSELAVLSGCSSAGGRALSGEGVLGLTGAFLSAGARAVVASLWDVDDAATAALMVRFYRGLADGRTVADALARARRELAGSPGTTAPRYWAGFVVVGDGSLRVPLQKRASLPAIVAPGAATAAVLVGGLIWWRRRRRMPPVISSRGRSLS